ncbi:TonB-dependent receptor [Thalassotalea hakodatensis]|uniref:TonB-dependent receptor n=1 Tax=Thalassotalea hakodatensis TaxID=3030492 RepID=UPI0025734FA2|nr:TonB-dependent receptor [Thalassotalea hakodatensis]
MKFIPVVTLLTLSSASSIVFAAQQVSGIVKNASGEPIQYAKVAIVNSKKVVLTDEFGRFSFTGIESNDVELHVSAKNFAHQNQKIALSSDNRTKINFSLKPSVMEVVDVHATPLHSSTIESALPVNVIASDELRTKQASTLGETLKNEVGVHSTYFGPVSSSPIIRGLDGPRVLITQNGLDVGDASRVGPDHVVSTESATAQQIEVLRGPATLFYGSGAIGGVVNVVDNRVPKHLGDEFSYLAKHNTVASEDELSLMANTSVGNMAFHVDGFWRDGDDYKIPGYAELEHDEDHDEHDEEHDHEEEHEEHAQEKGILANSASKSSGFTIGTSFILDEGFIGFSYGKSNREYGIPGHSHGEEHNEHEEEHDHDHEEDHDAHEENVWGDLTQERLQFLSELNFNKGIVNKVASKLSYTDYQHKEIEGDEIGTVFNSEMLEARFDIFHNEMFGWKGAWTLHYKTNDFEAIGAEAFTPPSETNSVALAWLEERHFNDLLVQLGVRIEHVEVSAHNDESHDEDEHDGEHHHDENELTSQDFTPVSLSAGFVWDYQPGYNIGLSLAYSQRAPSAAELFSNGPHIGTNTFEKGAIYSLHNDHFHIEQEGIELETATNIDLTWRKFEGDLGFVLGAFYNQVDDYFYQTNTGLFVETHHEHGDHEEEHDEHEDEHHEGEEDHHEEFSDEGLPVYVYQQRDVEMYGVEAEVIYQWTSNLRSNVYADYTRAKLKSGGNLPRIPPMRIGATIDYTAQNYSAQLSVNHYFDQDDISQYEEETKGYTLVDAHVNYYLDGIGDDFVLFVKGNNLTDEEARVHTSFLKNVAPLPGRGIELGIRGSF